MNQNTSIIIGTVANLIWGALLVWGFLRSLRPRHNEVMFFTGKVQDALLQAKNTALEYNYEILHVSIAADPLSKTPGQFTLVVTYKTKT